MASSHIHDDYVDGVNIYITHPFHSNDFLNVGIIEGVVALCDSCLLSAPSCVVTTRWQRLEPPTGIRFSETYV